MHELQIPIECWLWVQKKAYRKKRVWWLKQIDLFNKGVSSYQQPFFLLLFSPFNCWPAEKINAPNSASSFLSEAHINFVIASFLRRQDSNSTFHVIWMRFHKCQYLCTYIFSPRLSHWCSYWSSDGSSCNRHIQQMCQDLCK